MKMPRNKQGRVTTAMLLSRIFSTKHVENYMLRNQEHLNLPTLAEHLSELCVAKDIKASAVIKNADMDRFYGGDLFTGKRDNPSRDYVLRLAFGFGLDYEECQQLLTVARHSALYPRVPRDAVIISCLHHKQNYKQAEDLLDEMGFITLNGQERVRSGQ